MTDREKLIRLMITANNLPTLDREADFLLAHGVTIREPGEWIHDINNLYGCSKCGEREIMSPKRKKKFCPACGAPMKGSKNG